jgi:hypothetical protein
MALGRVAIGSVLTVAPVISKPLWVRSRDFTPGVRLFGRMTGARDLAIGLGGLVTLNRPDALRPWLVAGMIADATDIVAAVMEGDGLPRTAVPIFVATAGAGVAMGAYALAASEDSAAAGSPVAG